MSVLGEQQQNRDFVDALRRWLGMKPLYLDEQRRPKFSASQRWIASMEWDGNRRARTQDGSRKRA